ncbi:MAG: rod shape-determining protein [Saprospiraceae bacterium]|nr:rod shape-determining protein [Saprospiraceae bacterium]
MGLFDFFSHEIAIDLGTANTLIIHEGKVVVDEPSIVAMNKRSGKVIAVGHKAMQMHGKTHPDIETVRPLKDGVIADFEAAENMITEMIKMINKSKGMFGGRNMVMVICIPSGITEVEKRAVFDSADQAGAKERYLIFEPMAAAIGIGLDVEAPIGNMIIDIGGGTTEIAVISLSGIVGNQSINIAGDEFTHDIVDYMRRQHNLLIGERTAETIKINVGSALPELEDAPEDYPVNGRDLMTGIPKQIMVNYSEVSHALDNSIAKIEEAIMKALEDTPPELASDIYKRGLYLTGGGALLRGLANRISTRTKLNCHVADDPLRNVVTGTGIALKQRDRYKNSILMDK